VTASASHSRVFRLARAPILPSLLPRQRQLPDRPRRHLSPRPREAQVLHRRPADDGDGDERQGAHPDQPGREPGGGHQAGGHLPRHHLPHHVVRGGAGRTPLGDDRFDGAGHDGAPRSEGGAVGVLFVLGVLLLLVAVWRLVRGANRLSSLHLAPGHVGPPANKNKDVPMGNVPRY
jgi:hypothetical protein